MKTVMTVLREHESRLIRLSNRVKFLVKENEALKKRLDSLRVNCSDGRVRKVV